MTGDGYQVPGPVFVKFCLRAASFALALATIFRAFSAHDARLARNTLSVTVFRIRNSPIVKGRCLYCWRSPLYST